MSKRTQEMQGGGERYGGGMDEGGPRDTADKPLKATAAQMANRK